MLVDPDVVALAARIEAMKTSGTADIGNDESDAIEGTQVRYDRLDDVWRCSECFWEVAFGACEHCGRVAVNRNDMAQHDLQVRPQTLFLYLSGFPNLKKLTRELDRRP